MAVEGRGNPVAHAVDVEDLPLLPVDGVGGEQIDVRRGRLLPLLVRVTAALVGIDRVVLGEPLVGIQLRQRHGPAHAHGLSVNALVQIVRRLGLGLEDLYRKPVGLQTLLASL